MAEVEHLLSKGPVPTREHWFLVLGLLLQAISTAAAVVMVIVVLSR